jgi:NAD(P)-dependent dehydrogenase (short-subunit alcohol dehydrogenase family)
MGNKTWYITGTSRGFGRTWAISALERGDRVAATARDVSTLGELVTRYGDAVLPLELEVTSRAASFDAIGKAHQHFGRLDVVINNAGYGQFGFVEELSEAEARAQIETNLFGALWTTQAAIPLLRAQGGGHIVQVSSIGGVAAFPSLGIYHASKWALEGLTEALAAGVGMFGIRTTLIEPGGYATDWGGASAHRSTALPQYQPIRDALMASWAGMQQPAADAGGGGAGGCEADLNTDENNCGACFRTCEGPGVAFPMCKGGECVSICESGFVDINHPDKSMPDDGCEKPGLRVFLKEAPVEPIFGDDLSDADAACQIAASDAALEGEWRAWLVNSQSTPLTRFMPLPPNNVPFYRLDNELAAMSFTSFATNMGQLSNPINVNEFGQSLRMGEYVPVWIGATSGAGSGAHCNDWNEVPLGVPKVPFARFGNSNATTAAWANAGTVPCAVFDVDQQLVEPTMGRLYCFEQVPPP